MLALCMALQSAGHKVLLAGPPEKKVWAESLGCPFRSIGENLTRVIDSMEEVISPDSAIRFITLIRHEIKEQFKVLPELIAGADLVIGASLVFALSSVAEAMNIKYRYIAFTPQLLVSRYHPCFVFKTQRLPYWINLAGWKMLRLIDRFNMTALVNRERRKIGLNNVADIWENLPGHHVIVANDREIAAIPPDIKLNCFQTGYLHLQHTIQPVVHDKSTLKTQEKIKQFLSRGTPPIYAGFGSMPLKDQARSIPMVIAAVRLAGSRAVISKFWDRDVPAGVPMGDDILFIRNYPHLKLFPHMAAAIHHGGAGTTATCAASGVPQIIVPHILDQYYHAHKVYQAGLGPRPVWRQELTVQRIAGALKKTLLDDKIRQQAKLIGEKIDIYAGLNRALFYIEALEGENTYGMVQRT